MKLPDLSDIAALQDQLKLLPLEPGVYLFKDDSGAILYVGKAKSLRLRVRSYFNGHDGRMQIPFLLKRARSLDIMITGNEKEALILENTLIKQYRPRYNIDLKDDKSPLLVRVDMRQKFPRIELTRKLKQDGARYFGPFHSARAVRETVRVLNRHFKLRTCNDRIFHNRSRPCLQYEIKRCPGPCVLSIDEAAYLESASDVVAFFEGRQDELVKRIEARMITAAEAEAFEQAALYRDQMRALSETLIKQQAVDMVLSERDVFGYARESEVIVIALMRIREGKISSTHTFTVQHSELATEEVIEDAVRAYYGHHTASKEVLLPIAIESQEALADWLQDQMEARVRQAVHVHAPQRGAKARLIEIANKNAFHHLQEQLAAQQLREDTLEQLQRSLRLSKLPRRIECFDISHFQGSEIVASQVTFIDGRPAKQDYRRYTLKSLVQQDDFAAMHEVILRRVKRGMEEGELPDLIVVDGGIGQLNAARSALQDLGMEAIEICALAKSRILDDGTLRRRFPKAAESASFKAHDNASPERIFLPGQKNPLILKPYASALKLLTYLRDEAHRFAITHQQKRQKGRSLSSQLSLVAGLGVLRQKRLLGHFGSLKALSEAAPDDLRKIPGVPFKIALRAQLQVRQRGPQPTLTGGAAE